MGSSRVQGPEQGQGSGSRSRRMPQELRSRRGAGMSTHPQVPLHPFLPFRNVSLDIWGWFGAGSPGQATSPSPVMAEGAVAQPWVCSCPTLTWHSASLITLELVPAS